MEAVGLRIWRYQTPRTNTSSTVGCEHLAPLFSESARWSPCSFALPYTDREDRSPTPPPHHKRKNIFILGNPNNFLLGVIIGNSAHPQLDQPWYVPVSASLPSNVRDPYSLSAAVLQDLMGSSNSLWRLGQRTSRTHPGFRKLKRHSNIQPIQSHCVPSVSKSLLSVIVWEGWTSVVSCCGHHWSSGIQQKEARSILRSLYALLNTVVAIFMTSLFVFLAACVDLTSSLFEGILIYLTTLTAF